MSSQVFDSSQVLSLSCIFHALEFGKVVSLLALAIDRTFGPPRWLQHAHRCGPQYGTSMPRLRPILMYPTDHNNASPCHWGRLDPNGHPTSAEWERLNEVTFLRVLDWRFFPGHGSGLAVARGHRVRFRVDIADLDYPPTYLDRVGKLQV